MDEPIAVAHPSEFIREEMDKRDWGTPSMARHMGGDYDTNLLAIEMYLSVGEREPGMRLGALAQDIARAFGTSAALWQNLETSWLKEQSRRRPDSPRMRDHAEQYCTESIAEWIARTS